MFFSAENTGGLLNIFTNRKGGKSSAPFNSLNFGFATGDDLQNVEENYRLLSKKAGFNKPIITCKQVHKTGIAEVQEVHGAIEVNNGTVSGLFNPLNKNYIYSRIKADALYTETKNLPIGVYTADCLPVIVSDKKKSFVMAIHCGWRGVVDGIVEKSFVFLQNKGKTDFEVILGPAINQCCFELKHEGNLFDPSSVKERNSSSYVNLKNEVRLRCSNTAKDLIKIDDIDHCTCCNKELFFSYRRDKTTGRHINIGCLQA
ncbi:MAG: laccase domain-containing protein [Nitrospinae bacterium]|nr:laccase domain-containing protein [Nitrospinota bacterium]